MAGDKSPTQTVDEIRAAAWVIPGDDYARADGFLDAMAWQEGEFSKPLYDAATVDRLRERIAALEAENERLRQDEACHDEELFSWEQDFAMERRRAETAEADLAEARKALETADRFRITDDITVESRGNERWAVVRGRAVLASDGEWEYEPMPSGRDEAFIGRTRYTLDDAFARAFLAKEK